MMPSMTFLHAVFALVKEVYDRLKIKSSFFFFGVLNWLLADVILGDPFFHCMYVVQIRLQIIGLLCMNFFQHVN